MKINNINKCKCGCDDVSFLKIVGPHNQVGVYCSSCGQWLKWASKNDKNLAKMQGWEDKEVTE